MTQSKPTAAGSVRDVAFLDTETCFWQLARQQFQQLKAYSASGFPHIGRVRGLKGHRWLVIACDTKIVLQDLASGTSRDIPRSLIDSRAPTRLAFLFVHSAYLLGFMAGQGTTAATSDTTIMPMLAVGTSSGTIFLLSVASLQVAARLVGGHKAAVTALLALPSREPGGPDALVSAGADGTVAVWEPSASASATPDRDVAPKVAFKAHEGEVLSATLCPVPTGAPEAGPLRLITAGEDKRVAVWDAATWREVVRTKPLGKAACNGLAGSMRAGACTGAEASLMMTCGDKPAVWGMCPGTRGLEVTQLASLEGLLPAGTKKVPKIYTVACHPLRPHLVAIGANCGVGLLEFDPLEPPPGAPMSLPLPGARDFEGPTPGGASRAPEYLFASPSELWKLSWREGFREDVTGRHMTADLRFRTSLSALPRSGRAEVAVSCDGLACSVVWPEEREYVILSNGGQGDLWQKLDGGPATSIAWSSAGCSYAVLHVTKSKPDKRGTRRSKDEPVYGGAVAGAVLQMYMVNPGGRGVQQLAASVELEGAQPVKLHGGNLLAVGTSQQLKSGQRRGRAMRLVSWQSHRMVGPGLVEPAWLAWDPDASFVAMGYPDAVVLYRLQPQFTAFASLPLKESTHALCMRRQLFVVSPSSLHCLFVAVGPQFRHPLVEVVRIASVLGGIVPQAGSTSAALPTETLMPGGPVRLVGVREGALWLLDPRGLPFVIPLSHPGLKARALAAQGQPAAACAVAEQGLEPRHQDALARFVAAVAPQGAAEAVQLSGLSLKAEVDLARQAGQLRRAVHCLAAVASGAHSRSALEAHPLWARRLSAAAPTEPLDDLVPGFEGDGGFELAQQKLPPREPSPPPPPPPEPELEPQMDPDPSLTARRQQLLDILIPEDMEDPLSSDEEAVDNGNEGDANGNFFDVEPTPRPLQAAPEPSEPVDWDAPLAAPQAPSGEEPSQAKATPGLARWVQRQSLQLAEAALLAGDTEAAKAAVRVGLASCSSHTPPEVASKLLQQASKCGLAGDIHRTLLTAQTGGFAAATPLLAALADDPSLVTRSLQAYGSPAMAAAFTHAWRTGDSIQALTAWGNSLNDSAGIGSRFTVAPPA